VPACVALLGILLAAGFDQLRTTREVSWSQWGGPDRNFTIPDAALALTWPATGPPVVWRRPLGEGHSAIVGDGRRLFTMYRTDGREFVIALDAATGKTLWDFGYLPLPYDRIDPSYGRGPHATPLLRDGRVYAIGTTGRMSCLDAQRGTLIWSHELWRDFGGSFIINGYASSPIAYRDTVIVQVGGPGKSLVAFDAVTGTVRWQAHSFRNSQSSPILVRVDGVEQLVAYMHNEIVGVNPDTGALLWRHPVAATMNFHFNIATPVWGEGNLLFASSAYGVGGRVLRLSGEQGRSAVTALWQSERTRIHHENAIRIGDTVFASTGHLGPAFLTAFNVQDGRVLWQDRSFSHAMLLRAGNRLLILDEDGTLGLATATARGLVVHARAEVLKSPAWTAPTLIGPVLYLRDRQTIAALRVGPRGNGN
jgi:outer membrane protein assembly factor BamB